MGWEFRGNRLYYYRKQRIGNRVVSEYIGAGPIAELVAVQDENERQEAERQIQAWKPIRDADRALVGEIDGVVAMVRALVKYFLLLAGYRTRKGTWCMNMKVVSQNMPKADRQELSKRKFWEVIGRVDSENPSRADLEKLHGIYNDVPSLYRKALGLSAITRQKILDSFVPQASMQAAMLHEITDMRSGMDFDSANGLERLLIDTVILAWLRVQQAEYSLSSVETSQAMDYWDGRLSAAQRRFLRASETLARVRKLTASTESAKSKQSLNAVALLNSLT
ncbi:hypothetical protein KFU94_09135 [Chloroflexi bacterium TSY]|nr:hypothetical protein [Chloroflexi bacterium TSY]